MANILVVDDEELFRTTLCQMLEEAGHAVLEAANGEEALRIFDGSAVELVVTDIIMPEMEGIETIKELLQRNPKLEIIAISGGGRANIADYLEFAKKLGANSALSKPFRKEELLKAVNAALGQAG